MPAVSAQQFVAIEVRKNHFSDMYNTNNEPFSDVSADCLRDRAIYRITAWSRVKYKAAVLTALIIKYGPCTTNNLDTAAENYEWHDGNSSLMVLLYPEQIMAMYENSSILKDYEAQVEKENAVEIKSVSSNLNQKL
jgi:hypothetical protein